MISAINNKGLLRFMMYESTMTAGVLLKFMKRLIKDADRKLFAGHFESAPCNFGAAMARKR
ncbi:hypothetical protein SAMN02745220_04033 [Desulfopila aestuarii DSM 18488]|uniref:Uncharacterized protein n=2 Tax=Desulfopila aestuarii TaxID=231440 RepID=A0A1M7YFT3_9BACT|nr:hypothetical protein SAMN02745220_04033 [Desulfopila aestuarii DSM 18488]